VEISEHNAQGKNPVQLISTNTSYGVFQVYASHELLDECTQNKIEKVNAQTSPTSATVIFYLFLKNGF